MSVTPNENDVLLGRGHFVNNYPGNLRFRRIANEQKPHYIAAAKRKEKRSIALGVIMEVQSSDPPGRFLIDSSGSKISVLSDGVWEVASQDKALEKVLHRMREKDGEDCLINTEKGAQEKESVAPSSVDDGLPGIDSSNFESQSEGGTSELAYPVILLGSTKPQCADFEMKRCTSNHTDKNKLQHCESPKVSARERMSSLSQATDSKSKIGDDNADDGLSSADVDKPSDNIGVICSSHLDWHDDGAVADGSNTDEFRQRTKIGEPLDGIEDIPRSKLRELSLSQWINENSPKQGTSWAKGTNDASSKPVSAYVNSALLVASKVTEYLMLADQMQKNGSLSTTPLAIIKTSHIVIGVNRKHQIHHEHDTEVPPIGTDLAGVFDVDSRDTEEHEANPENDSPDIVIREIVHVNIDSPLEMDPSLGSVADRLVALGIVFVELFSFGNRIFDHEESNGINSPVNTTTLGNMNLNRTNPKSTIMHTQKKHSYEESNCPSAIVARLALLGIPHALCALVEDLLECNQEEFCRDDAYRSFEDVYSELQLMIKEPSKYLCNNGGPRLVMSDKLYGREEEIKRIQEAYKQRANGDCAGVVISGEAGVGKSRLARIIGELNRAQNSGTILGGKFDQIQYSQPLSVIATVFDDMCRFIAADVRSQGANEIVALCLEKALGSQAILLSKFLPSLSNLVTLDSTQSTLSYCTDSAESVRFLFCKTVEILSSYSSGPITIFLDDVQWADPASLLLISSLLQCSKENKRVFFLFCVRDNEIQHSLDSPVHNWYQSTFEMPLKHITLANLSEGGVNAMVSDTLGLFPRLTRPLSKVLHRKALGNPFFVWQILETLQKEGYLYHSLRGTMRRWMWDMDKISDLRISENVLFLLMSEMNKLPSDMRMGLEVASCMGANVSMIVVGILSSHLKVDLAGILERVAEKGFIDRVGTEEYRFVHDRVQQAAYEMMTEDRRRENHMAFGLAICSESMNYGNDSELMFTAINQINRGGPGVLVDFRPKSAISALNLKVGRRSATLTDFAYAYFCFKNGISFLNEDHWKHQYQLSIDLHDAAADAACALSDTTGVQSYSQAVLSHATSLEDKLNAMFTMVKSLRMTLSLAEAEIYAVRFLMELGEEEPRMSGNPQLDSDISSMIVTVSSMTDDSILNLKQSQDKKLLMLMNLCHEFFYIFQMVDPSRLSSVSLRMVQLSFGCGITELSPLAFAQFGVVVLSGGNAIVGYRMGSLALKLARNLCAPRLISSVIAVVQPYLAWVAEPLQTITESHQHGHTLGAQCGDVSSSTLNYAWFCMAKLLSGGDLEVVRRESCRFLKELRSKKQNWGFLCASITYLLSVALIEGPNSDVLVGNCDLPSETHIFAFAVERKHELISFGIRTHRLIRNFLFRQYDEMSNSSILSYLLERKPPLHSLFIIGVFYQGLTSYCIARRTRDDIWTTRGNAALTFIQHWSHSSQWNFQNKVLLLQAEKSFTCGNLTEAQNFYKDSITSARRHKFIHEEGVSHELSGLFFLDRGLRDKAHEELLHSVRCFRTWGAYAVADRVNILIGDNFSDTTCSEGHVCETASHTAEDSTKRRYYLDF